MARLSPIFSLSPIIILFYLFRPFHQQQEIWFDFHHIQYQEKGWMPQIAWSGSPTHLGSDFHAGYETYILLALLTFDFTQENHVNI